MHQLTGQCWWTFDVHNGEVKMGVAEFSLVEYGSRSQNTVEILINS